MVNQHQTVRHENHPCGYGPYIYPTRQIPVWSKLLSLKNQEGRQLHAPLLEINEAA